MGEGGTIFSGIEAGVVKRGRRRNLGWMGHQSQRKTRSLTEEGGVL